MLTYLLVAIGGALGSVSRFALSGFIARSFGDNGAIFPWGTLVVNVTGSFVIGFFAALTSPEDGRLMVNDTTRQFFMIGICGGYTTFSSFSLETLNRARDGEWLYAGGNVVASVVMCLSAVWLGHVCATAINLRKGF